MGAFSGLDLTRAYGLDFLVPAKDEIIGAALRTYGEFARPLLDAADRMLAGGAQFIDVGANIGSIALPIAARRPTVDVVAVEASRPLATILAANALGNRLGNVAVVHAAAGREAGLAEFPVPSLDLAGNLGALSMDLRDPRIPLENVRVCTLDELAAHERPTVVKLDVEGFEAEVIAGASRLIASGRTAWIVEATDRHAAGLLRTFFDAGYDLYWLYAPFVTVRAMKCEAPPSTMGDPNIVALPKGARPPMDLPRITSPQDIRPVDIRGYPYLRDYGFSF